MLFQQEMFLVYNNVRCTVEQLNDAIKRVNEEQAAHIAQALRDEQERQIQEQERQAQEQRVHPTGVETVPKKEVEKKTSVERQSSTGNG